jgi:hypothetical protein
LVDLESRTLLSTIAWLRPVSGDWNTAANWAGGHVPGANDDAVIPFANITVTHATAAANSARTLLSEASLDISAGSLTIGASGGETSRLDALVTVTGGTLSFINSTVDGAGTLRNFATLNLGEDQGLGAEGVVNVAVDNEAGTLTAFGQINNDAARPFMNGPNATLKVPTNLDLANGFTNLGHMDLGVLSILSGTLVNAPSATINGGSVAGSVDNQGSITIALVGGLGKSGGTVTNEGTITVNHNGNFGAFTVFQSAFTNTGTITLNDPMASLTVNGGTFAQDGTLSGPGTLGLQDLTVTFAPGAIGGVGFVSVVHSSVTSPTPLTNLVNVSGGSTINAAVVNAGKLTDGTGTNTINGTLTNAAGATLSVTGTGNLTVTQGLTNNGSIMVDGGGGIFGSGTAELTVTGGTLTNAPGATISFPDAGGASLLNAALDNQGTVTVSQATVLTGSVTNSGTIHVQPDFFGGGDLTVNLTDASMPVVNTGTITIDSMRAVIIEGGNFINAGTVAVGSFGTLFVSGGYTQTGGLTMLGGGVLTAGSGLVDLEGGVLAGTGVINATVLNNAEVDVGQPGSPGALTIVGDYTQTASAVLVVEIGGPGAGTGFDQLNITGQATLDGTLTVHLINGFQPESGASFQILTFGSGSGTFATINGDGPAFTPRYNATDVNLVAN